MKTKMYVLAALLMASMANVMAEETTKIHPASGDTYDVALGYNDAHHLFIGKDKFESAVPGNIVRVHGWNTGDGAHKLLLGYQVCSGTVDDNKAYLPGGEIRNVEWTDGHYDICLTKDMLDAIRYGGPNCAGDGVGRDFRIYGEGITINVVDLIQPGRAGSFHEPFKTIWKGLFWVDGWTTKEINKATLAPYGDFSNVRAIRFYHEAGRTDYIINLFKDDFENKIAGSEGGGMNLQDTYAELILTNEMRSKFAACTDKLIVQGYKGSGDAFNLTDIVFVTYSPDDCPNCFYVY